MSARRHTVALGLLAVLAHPVAWAQDDASRTLVEQGRYWRAQGKPEQAAQAWEKLLLADPRQPEALYGMASIDVDKQQYAQARDYLARLRAAAPDSRYVPLLEQDLRLAVNPGKADIDKARLMAQDAANKNDAAAMSAAIAQYDKALGSKTPQGDVAREYYTYLGYTNGGLDRAIQGLQRLDREQPGNPAVMLPLAQHMARNERTRAEGIRRLQQLSSRADIGGAATEFWRTALTWLGAPSAEEKPLFESYLAKHPDDAEIRAQMQQVRTAAAGKVAAVPTQDPRLARGFAALKRGDMATAESEFTAKLKESPNNADALGGLGVVRMQQNNLPEAERLLASAAARPGGASWNKSLNSARYWNLINQANAAQDANDLASTRSLLEQALRLDAREPAGRNAVARLYASQGDMATAEKAYRAVLATDKNNREALSGLVGVLAQTGRADQAMQLVNSLGPAQQAELGDLRQVRAAVAAGRARAAEQRGDTEGARRALEDALHDDPNNPWTRLELARYYLDKGNRAEARRLVDGLLSSNPDMPDAQYASALLSMQMGEWSKARQTLAGIPPSKRTPAMASTEAQVNFQLQVQRASDLGKDGQTQEARALLARLEPAAGQNPALVGAIAQAYADAGDPARGMALLRQLQTGPGGTRPDVLLAYAGLLVKTGQDVEAARVLRQIQAQKLTPAQARQQEDLVFLYTVRQAELLRQRGDVAEAYDVLAPALKKRPNDPLVVAALARMYAEAGDNAKALELYNNVLANEPNNPNLLLGAAQVASQAGDTRYANNALERAVAAAPNDPDILAGAARVYRANGKTGKAADLLASAIAIKQQTEQTQVAMAPAYADTGVPANPFRSRSSSSVPPAAMDATVQSMPVAPSTDLAGTPGNPQQAATLLALPAGRPAAAAPTPPAMPDYMASSAPAPASTAAVPQDVVVARPLTPGSSSQSITVPQAPGAASMGNAPTGSPSDLVAMQNDLREIREERSPEIRVGAFVQSNNGADGMSRLTTVQEPVEVRLPLGEGKLSLRATPVQLNARSVGSDTYNSSQFGAGPVATLAQQAGLVGAPGSQKDSGVGLSVGYETKNLTADIGTTPLGFERNNVVGGVDWKGTIDPAAGSWYSVGASRRAVTDSLLSFAGARDSRTGDTWGGVTASGVSGQIGTDKPTYGVYGYGSWQYLDGSNVASNTRAEVGGGVYRYLVRDNDRLLTAGLNLGATFYNRNERFFTYGNGGYFSPQEFYALSVPITWAERLDRFSYKLQGSVGIQHFHESSADYFPTSSSRQAAAVQAAAALGLGDGAVYSGQSKTGVGYNVAATAEYQLANNWFVGATVAADNASDYRQYAGGLYLRYTFYPQTRPMDMPVVPYRSPYSR
ncbi:cellulose synthase subunit BcsC-related outer membrane protein [Achromobacter aloeverae]|uniref:Cellulose synthase n=1 Tax=Achromobacter aloeverae TaxID=1750518 RepID=A0A4Q1HGN6_9BURK|nr:cellulose synthase subunit BcsC-related outer membrane protein [Achromobacter aloeverae]RXN86640.1 cellulose synthase [Achromobacter aloeverae]